MSEEPDQRLDCEGLLCPLPVLRARKVLLGMPPGQVLEIRTTDPMARLDLPHFCGESGHDYLGVAEDKNVLIHRLRRGFHA